MNRLYVTSQNELTREWVPVAELRQLDEGYELRYTRGAQRLPGFEGLSRMQALDKVYYSRTLFPFFSNRLIPKSRPEYKSYVRWLGLDALPSSPLEMLAVTGGVRATDNYELVAPPRAVNGQLELDFFPRGLRYLHESALSLAMNTPEGSKIYLMKDVQNSKDPTALAIRTEYPQAMLLGYVPRYYCPGLIRLLDNPDVRLEGSAKRISPDAPLDMKALITLRAIIPDGFELLSEVDDFLPLTTTQAERISADAIQRTNLDLG
jgi:hypothetical protein